ncbi:MAG: DUF2752 domain-containing protein [Myxococcaceae bacterium]|nr:DUF2752 domain-containing protein [Myxococcaceae bacterium]
MQLTWPAPNRKIGIIDALALTGLIGLLVARFIPVARLPFWGCALRRTTGWPCPGCGLTRVADRMSHFNVAGAWDANPLGTIAAALFMAAIVVSALHLLFKVPLPEVHLTRREKVWIRVGIVCAVVINWMWVAAKAKFPEYVGG